MDFQPLKNFLDYYLPMLGVPGSDTVIYKDHEEIFRYQAGYDDVDLHTPVRPDALYNMYSCTKVATMTAAMQLLERGEILLSDPLYAYFPEYRDMTVTDPETGELRPAKDPILIRHLLTMTAGFDYNWKRPSIRAVAEREEDGSSPTLAVVRALASEPLCFDPGTRYQYSLCHDVVGGLVELVSGKRFSEYLEENVFGPLGMKNSTFRIDDGVRARLAVQYDFDAKNKRAVKIQSERINPVTPAFDSGGGGLISSVDDMILLADALTNHGEGKNGNRILSSASVELMRKNQLSPAILPGFAVNHHTGYGYGLGVRTNMDPAAGGNLASVGEFGWDGAKGAYLSCDPATGVALFHAQHMGGLQRVLLPRLRNVVCACVED